MKRTGRRAGWHATTAITAPWLHFHQRAFVHAWHLCRKSWRQCCCQRSGQTGARWCRRAARTWTCACSAPAAPSCSYSATPARPTSASAHSLLPPSPLQSTRRFRMTRQYCPLLYRANANFIVGARMWRRALDGMSMTWHAAVCIDTHVSAQVRLCVCAGRS